MKEELINKLDKDINCDLSDKEIELLYDDIELFKKIRYNRDTYEDLCRIYDPKLIARTTDEINENTNIFDGDLIIYDNIPTYNLKYIYGNLSINGDMVLKNNINLENLMRVFGNIETSPWNVKSIKNTEKYINCLIDNLFNIDSYVDIIINNFIFTFKFYLGEIEWNEEIVKKCVSKNNNSFYYIPNAYINKDVIKILFGEKDYYDVIEKYISNNYLDLLDCNQYVFGRNYDENGYTDISSYAWEIFESDISVPFNFALYEKIIREKYDEEATKRIIINNPQLKYTYVYNTMPGGDECEESFYSSMMKEIIECIPKDKFTYELALLIIEQDKYYIHLIPESVPNYDKLVELCSNKNKCL